VVVLALLAAAVVVGQWRYDLAGRLGLENADPATDPAGVRPPAGLQLPPQPAALRVATPVHPTALDPAAVRRALTPYVDSRALGKHVDVLVAGLSGKPVFRSGNGVITPASTLKLLTSTAALESLGSMARFTTSVHLRPGTHRIVLVGGGDPFLASTTTAAKGLYPVRATTAQLATATVEALKRQGIARVRLGYDASLFTGPAVSPAWPATYLSEDVVPPISALWVDEGRDADGGFSADPARTAGTVFAAQLRNRGIRVVGRPSVQRAGGTPEIAAVHSAPVGQIVERTLSVSDNNAAEVLARHVGRAERNDGSFVGATTAVQQVLDGLGIRTAGLTMHDGSGLSRKDRLEPRTLIDLLQVAASRPEMREVLTGLPVAGFSGSLADRYDEAPAAGRGRVRAKTGTLTGVSGLAGMVTDLSGATIVFVAMADRVAVPKTLEARRALDRITAALGACRCAAGTAGSTP
jgi:D-alanyl-D-alanine carboxypeptidase/D-alanyl-D-alanine-endopeptidase (penicillin-binding protein 4)